MDGTVLGVYENSSITSWSRFVKKQDLVSNVALVPSGQFIYGMLVVLINSYLAGWSFAGKLLAQVLSCFPS